MKAVHLLFAAVVTFAVVRLVAECGCRFTGVPKDFPPFTTLPLLSGVVGGFLGASLIYYITRLLSSQPNRIFFFIASTTLVLSFGLTLRLSFTKPHRFAGVTPAAQMTLALLHTMIATSAVSVLTQRAGQAL